MDSSPASNPQSQPQSGQTPPTTYFRTDRERVLEAMLRVSAAQGYEMAAIAEVAAVAEISPQRFEELFDDKLACFLEAYEAAIDVAVAAVASGYEATANAPWPQRVEAALRALVALLAAEAEIVHMAMVEITTVGEEARVRYQAALTRFAPFLEEGRKYSDRGDELPPDTAAFAVGGATSMIFDEVRAGRAPEMQRILPGLVFAVLMPYVGAEEADEARCRIAREG